MFNWQYVTVNSCDGLVLNKQKPVYMNHWWLNSPDHWWIYVTWRLNVVYKCHWTGSSLPVPHHAVTWTDAAFLLVGSLAPVTHVLQPVGNCLATKKQLQPMQPLCDQKLRFSVADQSATTIPKNRRPVGDRSATGERLIANWLEIGCDWSATGWRLVGDRSTMSWRLTIEQTIYCVGVIMNKALINCYSMAISISIMSYCLFWGYFLVRIYID